MSRVIVGIRDIVERYVSAVLLAAKDFGKEDEIVKDFVNLKALIAAASDLMRHVTNPTLGYEAKSKAVKVLSKHLKLSNLVENFLLLLVKNNRFNLLDVIVDGFIAKYNTSIGINSISVTLAAEVTEKMKKDIEKKLSSILPGKLQIDYEINPSIIGGVIIKSGPNLYDASIEGKLNRLKKESNEQILNMQ